MITLQHLDFAYKKGQFLFRDLNFQLHPGHIYGLLGRNGSGKSTLLKNMAGLLFPDKGACLLKGKNTAKRTVSGLEEIFFIPEDIFVPHLTPARFAKSTAGFYNRFSVDQFNRYLEAFDVDPQLAMQRMSFGQQKKAVIAFGLATNTAVLILDEPTNGLDIPSKVQFRKLIASGLSTERCIIISTHQVRDLDSLIDYLLILENGRLVLNDTIDHLMEILQFGSFGDTTNLPVLYEENSFTGTHAILRNDSNSFGKIDLELLFSGILSGDTRLTQYLKSFSHE
jgi:ABC-2 type transport system ATP-binding protein